MRLTTAGNASPKASDIGTMLAQNRLERATGARAKHPSLLAGLVFDEAGGRLTPTYAVKKGTRYRYYVSTGLLIGAKKERSNGRRIPAGNLEGLVIDRLRVFFADPGAVLDAIDDELGCGSGQHQLIERGRQAAEELEVQAPDKVKSILVTLACRVVINLDRIDVNISRRRLAAFLAEQSINPTMIDQRRERDTSADVTLVVPARLKRVGREMKMLVENSDDRTAVDHSLLRIIARAHDIQARLIQNTRLTMHDIAREERVSAAYVYNLLRLPWLAPDITTAIVNGEQPQRLNAKTLMRRASRLPAHWSEQRTHLGFR